MLMCFDFLFFVSVIWWWWFCEFVARTSNGVVRCYLWQLNWWAWCIVDINLVKCKICFSFILYVFVTIFLLLVVIARWFSVDVNKSVRDFFSVLKFHKYSYVSKESNECEKKTIFECLPVADEHNIYGIH